MPRLSPVALALAVACLAACGGTTAPTPTPAAPTITCASPITIEGITTATQAVSFPPPITAGGAPPVSAACTPQSGAEFPLGETTVTCSATDAMGRTASCAFGVTLHHRAFALTRYLAFGDSITAGENGRPIGLIPFLDLPNAYPTQLQQTFVERVPGQTITVYNAGLGGERAVDNGVRFRKTVADTRAEVVLLLEGINDVNGGVEADAIMYALRDDIRAARELGVQYVFVATILPVAPENCGPAPPNCRGLFADPDEITKANSRIREMVPVERGYLVDPWDLFVAHRSTYIDIDGLHLRPEGNRALAASFWDRILQVVPASRLFGS